MADFSKCVLVLEDGSHYIGESFGASGETVGEIVFNTCMSGYQEIMTDPSYNGQMVVMTYPLIGNYGINSEDVESYKPHVQGFIVKETCEHPSNWRCEQTIEEYFLKNGIIGIKGVDTRRLTRHLRNFGSMFGIISSESGKIGLLLKKLAAQMNITRNLVMEVTTKTPIHIEGTGKRVAVLDCGVKSNIVRSLRQRNCDVHIFPAFSSCEDILGCDPDGVVLSNGPGDPADYPSIGDVSGKLLGRKPILAICLGHQILGTAIGGTTYKLKYGHHGGNHPVKDLITGRCYITSQNHNYALKDDLGEDAEVTHLNLNDGTVEGFRHKRHPVISVQYHPEASPGPRDSSYIFDDFLDMMDRFDNIG